MRFVVKLFPFVFVSLVLLWTAPAQAEYREVSLDNDFKSEIEIAAEDGKRLVLFFHQAGCPYCDKMRTRIHPAPEVMDYYSKHFVMMESNIKGNLEVVTPQGDTTTEIGLAKKLRVRATPVFAFYDTDGSLALRATGYMDEKLFLLAGQYVVDGGKKMGKSFYRYVQDQK